MGARAVIFVGGGVIQEIISDSALEVVVFNTDIEAFQEGDLITFEGEKCYLCECHAAIDEELVQKVLDLL